LWAGSARAELFIDVGAGAALPTGSGEVPRFAAGVALGGAFEVTERDAVGLQVRRFHHDGLARALTSLTAFYRRTLPLTDTLGAFASAGAGAGLFTGCIENGSCELAFGLALRTGVGLSLRLSPLVRLTLALQLDAQVGMPAGAGVLLVPALLFGVGFW
jgi:hypothetical protein